MSITEVASKRCCVSFVGAEWRVSAGGAWAEPSGFCCIITNPNEERRGRWAELFGFCHTITSSMRSAGGAWAKASLLPFYFVLSKERAPGAQISYRQQADDLVVLLG